MLHIITPLYRFELIGLIYKSLEEYDDVLWHLVKSNKREDISENYTNNEKILIHNIDCDDNERGKKRKFVLDIIKDGYFCFLDDDTIFHKNMYLNYKRLKLENLQTLLIGEQIFKDGSIRLMANIPLVGSIDIGNAIANSSCLNNVTYPKKPNITNDFIFWNDVYNFYKEDFILVNEPISFYNFLR